MTGWRSLHVAGLVLASLLAVGCATLAPELVRQGSEEGGDIVANCKNVSPSYRVPGFVLGSYLTTGMSAFVEGSLQGFQEGLESSRAKGTVGAAILSDLLRIGQPGRAEAVNRLMSSPAADWGIPTNVRSEILEPFCRRFPYRRDDVSLVTQAILSKLPNYRLLSNEPAWGLFETDFFEQSRGTLRWRDRYVVFVDPDGADSSIVRIFRDIYIDRSSGVFNQGESVGYNESFLLMEIGDVLNGMPLEN